MLLNADLSAARAWWAKSTNGVEVRGLRTFLIRFPRNEVEEIRSMIGKRTTPVIEFLQCGKYTGGRR